MSDTELSMPWGGNSESTDDTVDPHDMVSVDSISEQSLSLDSPIATTHTSSDSDSSTYGTVEDERREQYDSNGSTSDEVDIRKLFNKPTVNLIRWLYRQNGIASTVVDKPVKDAFKYDVSLDLEGDNSRDVREFIKDTYIPKQKKAQIKARRDGVALLFWVIDDTNSVEETVENPSGVTDLRVISIDDLARGEGNPRHPNHHKVNDEVAADVAAANTEYDVEQLVVTQSGLIVVDDITSPDHEEFVGCMYHRNPQLSQSDAFQFIHADRLERFTERENVDGDMEDAVYGKVEGDSVLTPILNPLTGITKAEWALGQTLLRYTAPLHVVEIDGDANPIDGDWEEHISKVDEQLDNVNNKSSLTLPPAHSADTLSSDGEIDPEPYLDGLINDICAGAEITRSVLLGTQAGTVSGSSTDIKNYYNQVERERESEYEDKIYSGVSKYTRFNSYDTTLENVEWGPLFKIDEIERVDAMRTVMSAVGQGVGNYLFSLEDAQKILQQQWAEFDVDVDLDELSEEQMDLLDRVNTTKGKQFRTGESSEKEYESKHTGNNGGGREEGQSDDEENPT